MLKGTVIKGTIVLDADEGLPDGARVDVDVKLLPQPVSPLGEMLLRHAGKAVDLPEGMATQHDHYLHGTPKNKKEGLRQ